MSYLDSFRVTSSNFSYFVIYAFGSFLLVYTILKEEVQKRNSVLRDLLTRGTKKGYVDRILDSIPYIVKKENQLNEYLKIIDIKYTARALTKYRLVGIYTGFLLSVYLKNWMVVLPLALIFSNLPIILVEAAIERKQIKFNIQLAEALQLFSAEYSTIQTVPESILNILSKLKRPIRNEFERLYKKLVSGERVDECFLDFARRANHRDAMTFSQLMITFYRKGGDITPHLNTIISSIIHERIIRRKNKMELSGVRTINIILNALVPVAYIINTILNPDSTQYFTTTPNGRYVILFIALSSLTSLYLSRKITKYN